MSVTVVEETWHVTVDEGAGSDVVVVRDGVLGPPGPPGSGGGTNHHADLVDLSVSGHPAAIVAFTPTGSIASTNVQDALAEIGLEYVAGDAAVAAAAASALGSHEADTTNIHGIADTAALVLTGDARLSDSRPPNGAASGVLGGTYPNPSFAVDMATQAELDAEASTRASVDAGLQPLDSDLTAIAALATTAFGRSLLTLADAAAGRSALALGTAATHATTDYDAAGAAAAAQAVSQPLDADLTAIAALTTTAYGRSLLEAASAAAARTLLGLGSAATAATGDFDAAGAAAAAQAASQPVDSDLTAIAALSTTAFGRSLLALVDAAGGRTALGLGTAALAATGDFDASGAAASAQAASQPLDSELTAIAGLVSAANKLAYFTGSGTATLTDLTAAGRALIDDADAAAQRTTLGLGTAATQASSAFDAAGAAAAAQATAQTQVVGINTQTASYALVLGDAGQLVRMNNASANTLSIPTNASVAFPVGTVITVAQVGAGQTTISAVTPGTTTVNSAGATTASPKTRAQFSGATLIKTATDTWLVLGDIA